MVDNVDVVGEYKVSVEPPPKQGCESTIRWSSHYVGLVSVEPPPKQGCEGHTEGADATDLHVSVEPPPKQGCEVTCRINEINMACLS